MTGRGIDQSLPFPGSPTLHESWVKDARVYVDLAGKRRGPIKRPIAFDELWGGALDILEKKQPEIRLINLETAITTSDDVYLGKEVHYRMNPKNIPVLKALQADCCSLANNHVMDWGEKGHRKSNDVLVWSIHWGENWGYSIPKVQSEFAHQLIDCGVAHLIHGHSAHHSKAVELYKGKLIFYGCGDFMTDYEGIEGHEDFRGDLSAMYFVRLDSRTGDFLDFECIPLKLCQFRLA